MSTTSVLYDQPGPKARRRALIGTILGALFILALLGVAAARLADQGQFSMELWGPLVDPSNESFAQVWTLIGRGLIATLSAASVAIVFSLIFGVLLGVGRMVLGRKAGIPIIGFIELFRGLPVVVTIFGVWQIFPNVGIDVGFLPGSNGFWYLVIALVLYNSVIIAEILRAGVNSLPGGQGEAAYAIGMRRGQVMRSVLLPQAFRTMLPALVSQIVVILKDTSLAALLALYTELLRRGNLIGQALDNPIQMLFVVGLIFIGINYALSKFAEYLERRTSRSGPSIRVETGEAKFERGGV